MKVCLDVQPAVAQTAGVGRYTRMLAEHLGAAAGEADTVVLVYFDFRGQAVPFATPGAAPRRVRLVPGRLARFGWKHLRWPPFDVFAGGADLYHFPNFTIPPLRAGKAVVTIHDVSFLRFPEMAEARNRRHLQASMRATVRRADAVITDSEFSAREIESMLGVERERLFAVHLGVGPRFRPQEPQQAAGTRARLGLERPYLLTVGTVEPRKNLEFLVDVFERMAGFDGDLVVAGRAGWHTGPILARLRTSPRAARIRRLDAVTDADLPGLYAGAALFVLPSLYEGFGLPPLEAMACGTPVLSSAGGSLPEVLGPAAHIMPGFDADAWAGEADALLQDDTRRAALAAAGLERAAQFTWTETARKTWEIYRRVGCTA